MRWATELCLAAGALLFQVPAFPQDSATSWSGHVPAEDPLLGYRWEGAPEVPTSGLHGDLHLVQGEAGVDAFTRLYLPFDEGDGPTTRATPAEAALDLGRARWCAGRFGSGLRLEAPGSSLEFADGGAIPPARAWTLELWVRPLSAGSEGARELFRLGDAYRLGLTRDGHPRAVIARDGVEFVVRSGERVRPQAWNHVALVVDPEFVRGLRVVVNGVPRSRPLPAFDLESAAPAVGLRLGGRGRRAIEIDDVRLSERPLSTAELQERYEPRFVPGPRALTLRFAERTETRDVWNGPPADDDLLAAAARGDAWLWQLEPQAGALDWCPLHAERDRALAPFLPRTAHVTNYIGDGRVLVYGGETRDSHLSPGDTTSDTWIYSAAERSWRRVESALAPPPRCHQQAAYSADHDQLLLAGGLYLGRGEAHTYADAWIFDTVREQWFETAPPGVGLSDQALAYHPPSRRYLHVLPTRLRAYDPEQRRWSALPPARWEDGQGQPIAAESARGSGACGFDPATGRLVFFGGQALVDGLPNVLYDATTYYERAANRWIRPELPLAPRAHARSAFAHDALRGVFVLFGGVVEDFARLDEAWTFDAQRGWRPAAMSRGPGPRGGYHGMAYVPEVDAFVLAAGRASRERFLDEVWWLHHRPEEAGRARFLLDRARWSEARSLVAEARGGQLSARFRGSEGGDRWGPWSPTPPSVRFLQLELAIAPDEPESGARLVGARLVREQLEAVEGGSRLVLHLH